MTDFEHIVPLWRELENAGADYVLATIVAVEGSSYRKPGARMLLSQDGRRAGTVSGGCLEAAVMKKAWWLTADGPVVQRYSTLEDDGDLPYGSGCGGVVYILLERRATAAPHLQALYAAFQARTSLAIATILTGPHIGRRAFAGETASASSSQSEAAPFTLDLQELAATALADRASFNAEINIDAQPTRIWVDYRAARPGLWVFGAGDDAKPLVSLARELGWFVAVADGRSHLAVPARFPKADEVISYAVADLLAAPPPLLDLHESDAALLVTHSFEQDAHVMALLLDQPPLAYTGVLGPQRRTREVLAEAARLSGASFTPEQIEARLDLLHAPTGLDLGADTPASIALSILAEVQQCLQSATALPLREVRGEKLRTSGSLQ